MALHRFLRFWIVIFCAVSLLIGAGNLPSPIGNELGVSHAYAEEKKKNLFQLLFGKREEKEAPPPKTAKKPVVVNKPRVSASSTVSQGTKPTAVEKSDDARHVLVIGDFVASGLSTGLVESFAETANVVIDERTNGSSGLVRDDFFNWPEKIGGYIDELNPAIVVIALGSNDRQVMRVNGSAESVRSEAWEAEYVKRVTSLIKAVREKNTPIMWMGSPPYKFSNMSVDIVAFNEIYRREVTQAGGVFIDIWNGFVDEEGNFIYSGSDIKGQDARLRASDGINFTSAGKLKLAFYVERQLRPFLGDAASPSLISLGDGNAPLLSLPPLESEADLVRTNPISFSDPELDGGSDLLGEAGDLASRFSNPLKTKSFRQRLVEDGLPAPSHEGRADNFAWPG